MNIVHDNMSIIHLTCNCGGYLIASMRQDDQLTMRIDSETKAQLRAVAEAAGVKRAEWIRKKINESFAKLKR